MSMIPNTQCYLARYLGLMFLTAFGILTTLGSGGGDGGSAPQPLVYSGNTDPAIVTVNNAPTLVANVIYGGSSTANIPTSVSLSTPASQSAGAIVVADHLRTIMQFSLESFYQNNQLGSDIVNGLTVNEPLTCDSGSAYLTGQLSDLDGTGTLSFTYNDCTVDGITYDGTGSFRIDVFDFAYLYPTDATMNFTLMSMSSAEFNGAISGAIRLETDFWINTVIMTLNYVAKDNLTDKMYKFENCILTIVFDYIFDPSTLAITFTGSPARVYDSIHGYVDVDTTQQLVYSSIDLLYPDTDGVMHFYGAALASIRLSVISATHVLLELDLDGDNVYEIVHYLLWEELAANANTDLTDTDGDGMHDSWEITYELDETIDDAADDHDGDGFSNLEEYQSGTNPNDDTSTP